MTDPVVQRVERAVVALCEGHTSEAREELRAIDFPKLIQNRAAGYERVWGKNGFSRRIQITINQDSADGAANFGQGLDISSAIITRAGIRTASGRRYLSMFCTSCRLHFQRSCRTNGIGGRWRITFSIGPTGRA